MSNLCNAFSKILLGAFLFVCIYPSNLQAQEEKAAQNELPVYAMVNYMKIKPGQDPIALEQEIHEPMHQEAANRGYLMGWDLIGVWMPSGSSRKYDYITVDYYRGMPGSQDVPEGEWEDILKKVHPGKTFEEIGEKTEAARDLVWRELFVWKDGVAGPNAKDASFYVIHKMKAEPEDMAAYEAMESDLAKPIHEVVVKNGKHYQSWNFWQLVFPAGTGRDYNYLTGEAYTNVADMDNPWMEDAFAKAHPGKNMEKELEKVLDLREDVSTEAWWRIAMVRKQEASAGK